MVSCIEFDKYDYVSMTERKISDNNDNALRSDNKFFVSLQTLPILDFIIIIIRYFIPSIAY